MTAEASALPNELWHCIIQNLALSPLKIGEAGPDAEFVISRGALRSLCLTSRRFLDIARPYLYEAIILSLDVASLSGSNSHCAGANSLVRLLRTLVYNRDLRPLVKHLALPMTLDAASRRGFNNYRDGIAYCEQIAKSWLSHGRYFDHLEAPEQDIFDIVGLPTGNQASRRPSIEDTIKAMAAVRLSDGSPHPLVCQKLLAVLLALAEGVEMLLLQGDSYLPYPNCNRILTQLLGKDDIGPRVLPNLKCLQVQLDPKVAQSIRESGQHVAATAIRMVESLLRQPKLRRVDIWYGTVTGWKSFPVGAKGIDQLEEMNLTVNASSPSLFDIIQPAIHLKYLSLELVRIGARGIASPPPGRDLNDVILSRSETLEKLSIWTADWSPEAVADQLGPLGRLTCLRQLTQLQYLSAEPHLLVDWLEVNDWPRFYHVFPPNLVTLVFRFNPTKDEEMGQVWARSGLGAALKAPPEKWAKTLPRLRHIHLDPLPYSLKSAVGIREDLQKARIALTWRVDQYMAVSEA